MCIAADSSNALDPEVERLRGESGCLQEGHDEAAQTAVHMQSDMVLCCQFSQCDDVILTAVREIDRRAYNLRRLSIDVHVGSLLLTIIVFGLLRGRVTSVYVSSKPVKAMKDSHCACDTM